MKKKTIKKTPRKKEPTSRKASLSKKVPVKKLSATKDRETEELVEAVIKGIQERKGEEIVSLDLREINNRICDFFIVCQANSRTQVGAIAASVEEEVRKKLGQKPYHAEGYENAEWILLDYVTVVVHVFQPEARDFYNLESLWADADIRQYA